MAQAPAYTTVPGRLPDLLRKIREIGVPPKATSGWLQSLGFTSSNDRSLLAPLRQIGFIDASGTPTPAWKQYRGGDHKAVLGRAIKKGYEQLYTMYPNAHERSPEELAHFFTSQSDTGKQSIDKMVSTFKNLAAQAEFGHVDHPQPSGMAEIGETSNGATHEVSLGASHRSVANGLTVNINVQLTLPETSDEKVFAAFFKAMKEHLLADPPP